MNRILIIAGGTGGHIFPALAVARAMHDRGIDVQWLGTKGGLEEKLVPNSFPLTTLRIKAFRGKGLLSKVLMPWRLFWTTVKAYRVIRRLRPDVVLGMGGYVTAPGGLAAWLARIPLVIHEQNSIAGLANQLLSRFAKTVLQAFPDTFPDEDKVYTTGNPVRAELIATPPPADRYAKRVGPLRILVLGGSQGASAINDHIVEALKQYPRSAELIMWHQTGARDFEKMQKAYQSISVDSKVSPFIEDMAEAYCWADLVICRAGALTVSEIAAVGVAAIFIPYPFAVDDHQLHNSRFLEKAGAAMIVIEKTLTTPRLIELLQQFANDRDRLLKMAECARHLSEPRAVDQVVAECGKFLDVKSELDSFESNKTPLPFKKIHCMGIGGIGVSAIAELLAKKGYEVTGSDIEENNNTRRLQQLGVNISMGHGSNNNITNADCVVYSSAISKDNTEYMAAVSAGIPLYKRGQMLAELMRDHYGIAVAGTHGKTTTSGLLAHTLLAGGMDPSYAVGGILNDLNSPAHLGKSQYFVAEADESDATLLFMNPNIIVITNIDEDHLETYKGDFNRLKDTFIEFIEKLPKDGKAVLCVDDPIIRELMPKIKRDVLTYGFSEDADYCAKDFLQSGIKSHFLATRPNNSTLTVELNMPGHHNALNALATVAVADLVHLEDAALQDSLMNFPGVDRRFRCHGEMQLQKGHALVIEDYGHHPKEIQAMLDATHEAWPDRRLVLVFQPHRYTRTRDLMQEFADVLRKADVLVLLEIYSASEKPIVGVNGRTLCQAVESVSSVKPIFVPDLAHLPVTLKSILQDQDVVILQGAGSVGTVAVSLAGSHDR